MIPKKLVVVLVSLALCANLVRASEIFKDVAKDAGLNFRHYNGMDGQLHLPEIMGSGAALFDFDNDGDLDAFLVQGNVLNPQDKPDRTQFPWQSSAPLRSQLFRNDLTVDAKGQRTIRFTDVTNRSGINANGYGMGVATGDFNNDGHLDLYVTNLGSNNLYQNNGDGTFKDVTQKSGTDDARWSTSASWFDYNRDGWLDLMVVNYAEFSVANSPKCYAASSARDYCGPKAFRSPGNSLFRNRGDGTFENVTAPAGVAKEFGHGLGVVTADLDRDGWIDIYVANDGDHNQLWINQKDGTFKNEALLAGAAVNRDGQAEASMGVDAGDFDQNGTEDLFMTHLMDETNTLYLNLGKAIFEDRTREAGIGLPGRRFTGFGTLFFDYDNDTLLDLLVVNGAVLLLPDLIAKKDPFPLGQPNQLFRNGGKGKFVEQRELSGESFSLLEVSRGAAFGDIDNDGDTDVLVTNNNGPARLLMNQVGATNRWFGLRLVGKAGRDMLGTNIEIKLASGKNLLRRARTDGSYLSANDPRVLVGLDKNETVTSIRVRWPDGSVEEFNTLTVGRYTTLREGESASQQTSK